MIDEVTVTPSIGDEFSYRGAPVWVGFSGTIGPDVQAGDTSLLTLPTPLHFGDDGLVPFALTASDGSKIADVAMNADGTGVILTFTDYAQTHLSTDFSARFPMIAGGPDTDPRVYDLVFTNGGAEFHASLDIRASVAPSGVRWPIFNRFTRADKGTIETRQALETLVVSPNTAWTESTVRILPSVSGNHTFDCSTVQIREYDGGPVPDWDAADDILRPVTDPSVYEVVTECDPVDGIEVRFIKPDPVSGVRYVVSARSDVSDRDVSLQFRSSERSRTVLADGTTRTSATFTTETRTLGGSGGGAGEVEGPSLRVEALVEQDDSFVPLADAAPGTTFTPGDHRVYYRITNNGNVGLENLAVDDVVVAGNGVVNLDCDFTDVTLAPGDVYVCAGDLEVTTDEREYQTVFSVEGDSVLTGALAHAEVEWFGYALFADIQISSEVSVPHGATVAPGDTITYTIRAINTGTGPGFGGWFNNLDGVLDDAEVSVQPAVVTSGTGGYTVIGADGLTVTDGGGAPIQAIGDGDNARLLAGFDLDVGQEATFTYTVVVNAYGKHGDANVGNHFRAYYGEPLTEVPEAWMDGCVAGDIDGTECHSFVHPVAAPAPSETTPPAPSDGTGPATSGGAGLATTGGDAPIWLSVGGAAVLLLGVALFAASRVRRRGVE
ncbi:DUF7927 domain-containing protein [Microbacterium sp. A196]